MVLSVKPMQMPSPATACLADFTISKSSKRRIISFDSLVFNLTGFGLPSNRCPSWGCGGCANVGVVVGRPLLRVHRTVGVGVGSFPPCWRNRRVGVVGWPPCWGCRPSFPGFLVGSWLVVLWASRVQSKGVPKPFVGVGLDNCGNRWRIIRFVIV